jgi:phospholipid/cholesterol/gamma-HCH transport system substrate-binding protein
MDRRLLRRRPPYRTVGLVTLVVMGLAFSVLYLQFRGELTPSTKLTLVAPRAGLVMDPGSKVTFNGVQIGRVSTISEITHDGKPAAKVVLNVTPKYVRQIPVNVAAAIKATTVFGNKYVALTSPTNPSPQPITTSTVIDATSVTTEFNSLFETLTLIAEKIDPVKVNLTLSAAAQALTGLGEKFGASLSNGNAILDDLNPQLPKLRIDTAQLAALGDTYANASPDLWDALDHAVTTARTLDRQQGELDAALLAAAGQGNSGADVFERAGPFLSRPASCSTPTAPKSSAPSATSTRSDPRFTTRSATTATRWGPTPRVRWPGRPSLISGRRTCRGPTPGVGRAERRVAGRRSPAICGPLRSWSWTPARAWLPTTTSTSVRRWWWSTCGVGNWATAPSIPDL